MHGGDYVHLAHSTRQWRVRYSWTFGIPSETGEQAPCGLRNAMSPSFDFPFRRYTYCWLGETSPKWPVLCRVGRKTTIQSIAERWRVSVFRNTEILTSDKNARFPPTELLHDTWLLQSAVLIEPNHGMGQKRGHRLMSDHNSVKS